jgi:hypothetical protein
MSRSMNHARTTATDDLDERLGPVHFCNGPHFIDGNGIAKLVDVIGSECGKDETVRRDGAAPNSEYFLLCTIKSRDCVS